jgi:hypothetical protein
MSARVVILEVETGAWLPGSSPIVGAEGVRLAASLLPGLPEVVIDKTYSDYMNDDGPFVIKPEAAQAVLHFFGDSVGRDPGAFVVTLLEAMAAADVTNRARLVAAFPEYGIQTLRDVVAAVAA